MKRILMAVINATTLCIHSTAQEEASPVETVEAYCKILAENFDASDLQQVNLAIQRICELDGWNSMLQGNQEALDWARKVLRKEEQRFASWYLMMKGDARDLDIISSDNNYRDKLATRVAGTNLVDYHTQSPHKYMDWFECFPSVTNTGPQGLYVQAILRQFWETLEIETHIIDGKSYSFRDRRKIPDELLTMVVWFDDDGNPVCNVDLEKYGLTMPILDVPNKPKGKEKPSPPLEGELRHSEPPREPETSDGIPAVESNDGLQPPEQTPPTAGSHRLVWFYLGIAVLILAIGGFYARRKFFKS